ncbi:MAG TPA: hypothetical protein PK082_07430, partial [Phycisphaerae bacterium]|nr:hypothetical protein [Phycisphaerae bacterium]
MTPTVFKCILLFPLVCVPAAAAQGIDDFDRGDPGIADTPAVTASLVKVDDNPRVSRALALDWSFPHKPWVECHYAQARPVPGLGPDGMVAIRLEAWIPAAPSVTHISLHLLDPYNETFQWTARIPPAATSGWRSLVIPIDIRKPNGHWGGRNGGRMGFPLKLFGYALVFANDKVPAGRVLIGQVRAAPLPSAKLETDRFPSLVNATGDAKCDLVVANPEDRPLDVTVKGTISRFSGQATPISGTLRIPAHGSNRLAIPLGDRQPGIRWLDCTLGFDGLESSYANSFAVADPVKRVSGPGDFLFGLCSHTEKVPAAEQELEFQAAAAAGATVMRIDAVWAKLEPRPGEWQWQMQDRLVGLAAKYGIEPQLLLGFAPSWAVSADLRAEQAEAYKKHQPDAWKISLFGPPTEAPWRNYVAEMVTRYRGRIRFYEIWNEPDLGFWRGTTDQYIQMLRAAYEEIKRADPNARVMTGGFATVLNHAGRAKNPDLQERVLAEASDSFDIHAFHQHGPFGEFKGAVEGEFRRIRKRMVHPRPVYFNETAFSSAWDGEKVQAITLAKKATYVMAQKAVGYTWYDLRNDGTNPADGEDNYGLLTRHFQPKAAFSVYMELVRQLQAMRHLGDLDLGPDREAHVFGGARGRVIVWWNEGRFAGALPVLFDAGGGAVRVTDVMGCSHELPRVEGVVMAQPSAEPQYLAFAPGEGMPRMIGPLVRLDGPAEAAVGRPMKLTAVLANPLARDITIKLTWPDPEGKQVTRSVAVPAGSTVRQTLEAQAPAARAGIYAMDLRFETEGLPWAGTLRYSAPVMRWVGQLPPDHRNPDWVLNTSEDVVSFTGADPALAARIVAQLPPLATASAAWQALPWNVWVPALAVGLGLTL